MRHMDVAYAQLGVEETGGPGATPAIVEYFRQAGRADVVSDEVPWCAAFAASCLAQGGCRAEVEKIPKPERLLARSFLKIGTAIDEPRAGAVAVFARPDAGAHAGHVGFVVGSTATHVHLLGGNQGNAVSVKAYSRAQLLGLRWPVPAATAEEIKAAGSRTIDRADKSKADTVKAGGVELAERAADLKQLDGSEVTALAGKAGELKGAAATLVEVGNFAVGNLKWIALAVAVYYAGRVIWHQWQIRQARVSDQNSGKLLAPSPAVTHEVSHHADV